MDIYCPRCAEPCDTDELHYADDLTFDEARRVFFTSGCGMLFDGTRCADRSDDPRAELSAVLADLLGDDVDGIASELDDADYLGMFDR